MQYVRETIPSIRRIEEPRTHPQRIEAVRMWRMPKIVSAERRSWQTFSIATRYVGLTRIERKHGRYEFSWECESHSTRFSKYKWHRRSDNGVQLVDKRETVFHFTSIRKGERRACVAHCSIARWWKCTVRRQTSNGFNFNAKAIFWCVDSVISIFVCFMLAALTQSERQQFKWGFAWKTVSSKKFY